VVESCGSAANKNICSKCYKYYFKKNNTKSKDFKGVECEMNNKIIYFEELTSRTSQSSIIDDMIFVCDLSKKNERKRCKKKIGLLGFQCHCGDAFVEHVDIQRCMYTK